VHAVFRHWQNQSWGLQDVVRGTIESVFAFRSDGASMEHMRVRGQRYWLIPIDGGEYRSIDLPVERLAIGIDFVKRRYSTGRLPDGFCCKTSQFVIGPIAPHALEDCSGDRFGWPRGVAEVVNGYHALRFDDGDISVWLAPSLGCAQVRRRLIERNWIGIPTRVETMEVTKFEFGEPDRALFAVPAGFRRVN
jgi:hypothetical protein